MSEVVVDTLATKEDQAQTSAGFNRVEVVGLLKESLNFIGAFLMPLQFTINFPSLHLNIWDLLKKAVFESELVSPTSSQKFPQIAIGWPRGHAKTTLVKLFVLWCIFFSRKKFILVVASNLTKAQNIVSDICDMLSEDNVLTLFGNWKIHLSTDRVDLKKFVFMQRDIIIGALGSGGDPRGLNIKNERPDIIIMDDIQSRECSASPVQAKALLEWMTATLFKAKSPHGCLFIYIGNMFSSPGCILKLLRKNPGWLSVVVAGILADGSSLWPELRSKEELMAELKDDIAMGTPESFFSEIMNDENAGVTSCFDITKVPPVPFLASEVCSASFVVIDVATDKINADDTTITHYSVYNGKPVADEMVTGRLSPGDTIKKSLEMCLRRNCPCIGVESVAYQSSLLYWFGVVSEQGGIEGIHFVELFPKGRSKNSRILTMLKGLIGSQVTGVPGIPDLYIAESLRPKVFYQISQFDPLKTKNVDDILDNLAYAQDMLQDYAPLILHPLSPEFIAFEEAHVLENNSVY